MTEARNDQASDLVLGSTDRRAAGVRVTSDSPAKALMRIATSLRMVSVALMAASCSSNASTPDSAQSCENDPRAEAYLANMSRVGRNGNITFTLVEGQPAPPGRGDNRWVVALHDANGPLAGANLSVKPFMPDHRHGTAIDVIVTPGATAGTYVLDPVNLWMPGIWETTLTAVPVGGTADVAVFTFCIKA